MFVLKPLSGLLLAGAHEPSISRDYLQCLVVKRDYPVAKSLDVISRNVSPVCLVPAIQLRNQRRVLNYMETVKLQPPFLEWRCIQDLIIGVAHGVIKNAFKVPIAIYPDSEWLLAITYAHVSTGFVAEMAGIGAPGSMAEGSFHLATFAVAFMSHMILNRGMKAN